MTYDKKTAELASGSIDYFVAGDGPPVLYLHSAGGVRMTAALDALAGDFRVHVPIQPGFDGTPTLDGVGSMPDLARLANEFIDTVIGGKCDVIGHSFGGWIAAWLAVTAPEKIGLLVLQAPAGFRPEGEGGLPSDPEELRRRMFAHPENLPPEQKPVEVLARNREMLPIYNSGTATDSDLVARLGDIEALTLILHGTKDGVIPSSSPRLLRERIPHAHLIYVYDAAHNIEVDQPDRFIGLVQDFLTRGEAFLVNPGVMEEGVA